MKPVVGYEVTLRLPESAGRVRGITLAQVDLEFGREGGQDALSRGDVRGHPFQYAPDGVLDGAASQRVHVPSVGREAKKRSARILRVSVAPKDASQFEMPKNARQRGWMDIEGLREGPCRDAG